MGLDIYFSKRKAKEIGYFRKVNFLVKYFKNLGFDVEHQIPLRIYKENIEDLLTRCDQVLKDNSKASNLLPTMSGFFFGNTEYNEDYFNDVKEVRNYIKDILLPEFDNLGNEEEIYFETWY